MRYDVVVIGSGPAGYMGAIRAGQLGLRVACVEKEETLGGTCLNVGCIPSKALLTSTHFYDEVIRHGGVHGLMMEGSVDLKKMLSRKDAVVKSLTEGIAFLFRKYKVERLRGVGTLLDAETVRVTGEKTIRVEADTIILATGSESVSLPFLRCDEKAVVSSTGALSFRKVPKSLAVVGGGYIGLELGTVWARLGSEVTVIEALDGIMMGVDRDIAQQMQVLMEKQWGVNFRLSTKITGGRVSKGKVLLSLGKEELRVEKALIAIGRRPVTAGLGLEAVGIACDEGGYVKTDAWYRTSCPNIYAVGDVQGGLLLAHKGEHQAIAAVEHCAGLSVEGVGDNIPWVVYTWPEVAGVGLGEEILKEKKVPYRVGKFPFMANARARASGQGMGYVKLLVHGETEALLGCQIIGPEAGGLIHEVVVARAAGMSVSAFSRVCRAHPTLNEALKEAALAAQGWTLNL